MKQPARFKVAEGIHIVVAENASASARDEIREEVRRLAAKIWRKFDRAAEAKRESGG